MQRSFLCACETVLARAEEAGQGWPVLYCCWAVWCVYGDASASGASVTRVGLMRGVMVMYIYALEMYIYALMQRVVLWLFIVVVCAWCSNALV